jgi:hypothetical protein
VHADLAHHVDRAAQAGGVGEAQVFQGPYWIVIQSPALFEPGDAAQLVTSVLENLPAA